MLKGVLPTMPVSMLRSNQDEIISTLSESPVHLTHNGKSTGVLVHHDTWNELIEMIAKLKEDMVLRQRMWEMDTDPNEVVTEEELRAGLIERGLIDDD